MALPGQDCNNCSGGIHHMCSPPCDCGCPASKKGTKEWLEKMEGWFK